MSDDKPPKPKKQKKGRGPDLAAFEAALDATERSSYDALLQELRGGEIDPKTLQPQFFELAQPVLDRLGGGHPGRVWGGLVKRDKPKPSPKVLIPLTTLADQLPYPLGLKLREFLQAERRLEEGEPEPQFAFELCALMGVMVRVSAILCVQGYAATSKKDAKLNHLVVDKIRKPSDGGWLDLAMQLGKALTDAKDQPIPGRVYQALRAKPLVSDEVKVLAGRASTTQLALSDLISFRNRLVHGDTISEDELLRARALVKLAAWGMAWLADYELTVDTGKTTWTLHGALPTPAERNPGLPQDEPCLVSRADRSQMLSLSPLLRFREGDGDDAVAFDELFFLNAGSLQQLGYIGYRDAQSIDGKRLGSYEAFKAFMATVPTPPIPKDPRLDDRGLAEFHARLFVGRQPLLDELHARIVAGDQQYVLMRALAGMGKTAVFASFVQAVINRGQDELGIPSPLDALIRPQDRYVFHFCMPTDGRNSPTVAMRSLIAQICDHFELNREHWLSHDIEELKDQKFPGLLARASSLLEGDQRLVVIIDALDEGIGSEDETVPSCIPAGTYDGVVFLMSVRVDPDNENARVAEQLKHLGDDRIIDVDAANPLAGLTRDDVSDYLDRLVEVFGASAPAAATLDTVWDAATRDAIPGRSDGADPFYLRFLADGVQRGQVRLPRVETIPASLDDAFEEMWMSLPPDRDSLCHRLLLTLAIMREYGDDELFAELFNRELAGDARLTPTDVAAIRVKAGKLLVYSEDRYGIFHDRFRVFLVGHQPDPLQQPAGEPAGDGEAGHASAPSP